MMIGKERTPLSHDEIFTPKILAAGVFSALLMTMTDYALRQSTVVDKAINIYPFIQDYPRLISFLISLVFVISAGAYSIYDPVKCGKTKGGTKFGYALWAVICFLIVCYCFSIIYIGILFEAYP